MEKEKKPIYKKWWFWVIIVILILIIFGNSDFQKGVQDGLQDNINEASISFENVEEINNENLDELFNNSLKSNSKYRENVVTDFLVDTGTVKVEYKMKDFWDEKDLIKKTLNDFCNYGIRVFVNDKVNSLEFYIKTDMIDNYGNNDETYVIKLGISRDEFEKFNFENLDYKPIYNSLEKSCYLFDFHTTLKNIDTSEILYIVE